MFESISKILYRYGLKENNRNLRFRFILCMQEFFDSIPQEKWRLKDSQFIKQSEEFAIKRFRDWILDQITWWTQWLLVALWFNLARGFVTKFPLLFFFLKIPWILISIGSGSINKKITKQQVKRFKICWYPGISISKQYPDDYSKGNSIYYVATKTNYCGSLPKRVIPHG